MQVVYTHAPTRGVVQVDELMSGNRTMCVPARLFVKNVAWLDDGQGARVCGLLRNFTALGGSGEATRVYQTW